MRGACDAQALMRRFFRDSHVFKLGPKTDDSMSSELTSDEKLAIEALLQLNTPVMVQGYTPLQLSLCYNLTRIEPRNAKAVLSIYCSLPGIERLLLSPLGIGIVSGTGAFITGTPARIQFEHVLGASWEGNKAVVGIRSKDLPRKKWELASMVFHGMKAALEDPLSADQTVTLYVAIRDDHQRLARITIYVDVRDRDRCLRHYRLILFTGEYESV